MNVDRPRLLGTINLRLLNHDLQGTFGFAEGEDDFGEKILSLQENINKEYINKEQGIMASSKPIETNTTQLFQIISWKDDPDIDLTRNTDAKNKCLISHVTAVSYSDSIPSEKWDPPKHLTKGTHIFMSIIEKVTGTHIKPTHPVYSMNAYY